MADIKYNVKTAIAICLSRPESTDRMDNVFIEWSDGKLSSFSDKQVLNSFERNGA